MSSPEPPAFNPEMLLPTEPPPRQGSLCAHCRATWGATPLADIGIHVHDRRVFARGTRLCAACAMACDPVKV